MNKNKVEEVLQQLRTSKKEGEVSLILVNSRGKITPIQVTPEELDRRLREKQPEAAQFILDFVSKFCKL